MNTERLRAILAEQELTQKDIATRVVDWLAANAGDALKLGTVESKLSKLLAGEEEGIAHFEHGRRGEALAHALGLADEEVRAMLSRKQVLLDPQLPAHAAEALRRQALACPESVEILPDVGPRRSSDGKPDTTPLGPVREARSGEESRLALLDASDANPRAVVVLAHDADLRRFNDRGRSVSFVTRVPRGYELESDPGLVPVPPPKPPTLWPDGVGGVPHVAHPGLTAWVREKSQKAKPDPYGHSSRQPGPLEQLLAAADERGEEPAFPLDEIGEWLTRHELGFVPQARRHGYPHYDPRRPPTPATREALTGDNVWWHSGQIYAIGPKARAFADLIMCHDVVVDPPEIAAWLHALATRNPFEPEGFADVWAGLVSVGLARVGGPHDAHALEERLKERRAELFAFGCEPDPHARPDTPPARFDLPTFADGEEGAARESIRRLSARPLTGVLRAWLGLPLHLGLAAESPLSPLPKEPFDVVHVLANLGAGRVLRIRIAQFEGAGVGPLQVSSAHVARPHRLAFRDEKKSCQLDGDGTHVVLECLYDELLEGAIMLPRKRREEAAARSNDDD